MSGPVPDLLPCPFCGTDEHLAVVASGSLTADMPARPRRVVCRHIDHDQVAGPVAYGYMEAITAWNTRSPDLLAMVEKLAEVAEMIANHVRDKNHSFEDDYWACRSIAAEALTEYHAMKGATEQGDL